MRMWDDLPSDVVVRILLNLSVKDVIRSTLLKKSIYSLVHSKFFIDTYNQHSLLYEINPPLIILQFNDDIDFRTKFSLRYYNAGIEEYMPLRFPFPNPNHFSMSNCCNSLVCLFNWYESETIFVLWNPYIQKTLTLPKPRSELGSRQFFVLGFVDEISDYKVFMLGKRKQVELYSLQQNSWKTIAHPGPGRFLPGNYSSRFMDPVYVKGSLYWIRTISDDSSVVGVFDFKDEVFTDISLPDGWDSLGSIDSVSMGLRVHTESSIAVVRDIHSVFHIQVMDVNAKMWKNYYIVESPCCNILGFNKEGDEIFQWNQGMHLRRIAAHQNGRRSNIVIERAHCIKISTNYMCNLALLDTTGENHEPPFVQRMLTKENLKLNS